MSAVADKPAAVQRFVQPALTLEEAVAMHNLLLRLGPFRLYERWIKAQAPEVCRAIQEFEAEGIKQSRAEAEAAAQGGARREALIAGGRNGLSAFNRNGVDR